MLLLVQLKQYDQTAIEVVAHISNYIPERIVHLITYPSLHPKCSLSTSVKRAHEILEVVLPCWMEGYIVMQ